ncbi:MAG: hypothetical protein HQL69_19345 [Magnetococcales bacterium]|nr:hypothetical protein [Magnetococcales bacterium]
MNIFQLMQWFRWGRRLLRYLSRQHRAKQKMDRARRQDNEDIRMFLKATGRNRER